MQQCCMVLLTITLNLSTSRSITIRQCMEQLNYTYLVFEAVEISEIINVNKDETSLSCLFYYLLDSSI